MMRMAMWGFVLLLPLTVPAVTTQAANAITSVERITFVYDGPAAQGVPEDALADSEAARHHVPSLGPVAGLVAAKTPFQIAEEGGRHAGFLKKYTGKSTAEIRKGITSLERQIAEHGAKITNPESAIPGFKQLDPRQQKALLESKWPSDIQCQQEQMSILKSLLGED